MKTQIQIHPAPENLTGYTHATLTHGEAESLAAAIEEIESHGATVIRANGTRSAVPVCYCSAHKMHAPHWAYDGTSIRPVDGTLENRTHGRSIPQNFTVTGETVPTGFRCFKRDPEAGTLIIRRK
jgi:hypothetical protein